MADIDMRLSPSGPDITVQSPIKAAAAPITVAVPAFVAAGDDAFLSIPFTGAVVGDIAFVVPVTSPNGGVVVSGCAICLAPNVITAHLVATKAFAGGNQDFAVAIANTTV